MTARRSISPAVRVAAMVTALLIIAACSTPKDDMETPPASEYTQAEAYAPMEEAATDLVGALPDFPGFEQRSWAELPCSRGGVDDPDYTTIEIRYRFALADSESALVREQYVDVLRDHWSTEGYEITLDDENDAGERTDRNLVAELGHGIKVWYRVSGYVSVLVQSGCVPVSEAGEIEYVPPAGGIEPGGEGDKVDRYFPDGVPAGGAGGAAVAPFDSPESYRNLL